MITLPSPAEVRCSPSAKKPCACDSAQSGSAHACPQGAFLRPAVKLCELAGKAQPKQHRWYGLYAGSSRGGRVQPIAQAGRHHLKAGAIGQRKERDGHPGHAPLRLRPALPGGPRNQDCACRQQPHSAHPNRRCVWCQHLQHASCSPMPRIAVSAPL